MVASSFSRPMRPRWHQDQQPKLELPFVKPMEGLRRKPQRWALLRRIVLETCRVERQDAKDRQAIARRHAADCERKLAQVVDEETYTAQREPAARAARAGVPKSAPTLTRPRSKSRAC